MADMLDDEAEFDAQLKQMLGHTDDAQEETEEAPADADTATQEGTATDIEDIPVGDTDTVEEDAMAKKAKAAERKMHEATQAAAELRKQNAALEQRLNDLQASFTAKQTEAKPEPVQDETGIDQAMEDYPEIVTPLVKHNKMLEDKLAKLEARFGEVSQTTDSMVRTANEKALESKISAIQAAHPDANDIVSSDEFTQWRNELPPMMAQAIYNAIDYAEPKDVIMALDMYKQSQGIPSNGVSKEDRLAAAKAAATPSVASRNKPQAQTKTLTREQLSKVSAKDFMADDSLEDLLLASLESGSLR